MKLQEKYLPMDYEEILFEELLLLQQGNTTVDDHTSKFHELSVRSRVLETDWQTIACYKAWLKGEIKEELLTVRLVSVDKAYQLALQVEQQSDFTPLQRSNTNWPITTPSQQCKILHHPQNEAPAKQLAPLIGYQGTVVQGGNDQKSATSVGEGSLCSVCLTHEQKLLH